MTHLDYLAAFKVLSRDMVYMVLLHFMEVNFSFQKPASNQNEEEFSFLRCDKPEDLNRTQLEVMYPCPLDEEFKSKDYKQLLKGMICLFQIDDKIKNECESKNICEVQDAYYILAKALRLDGTIKVRKKRSAKNDDDFFMIENVDNETIERPKKKQK